MILELTTEIIGADFANLEVCASIDAIALAVFHGYHYLTLEKPDVGLHILRQNVFGRTTQAVIKNAIGNYSFKGQLISLDFPIIGVCNDEGATTAKSRYSKLIGFSSITHLVRNPSIILGEHLTDAKIFIQAAHHYSISQKIKGLSIKAHTQGGGGSSIVTELENIISEKRGFCLTITDSDKRWPTAPTSETSEKCNRLCSSIDYAHHFSLEILEIENIIPLNVLENFISSPTNAKIVEFLKRIDFELIKHADLKKGVSWQDYTSKKHNADYKKYLDLLLPKCSKVSNRCRTNEKCMKNSSTCSCFIIPAIGALAPNFEKWLISNSQHKTLEQFSSPYKEIWLEIGAIVFSWCCGPKVSPI